MKANTIKLGRFNSLADPYRYDLDSSGVSRPPLITIDPAPQTYSNLSAAEIPELLRDGLQDLPVFFSNAASEVVIDWGDEVKPGFIALINHNLHEAGDGFRVLYSENGVSYLTAEEIFSPDRSVDKLYGLRYNDAWVNTSAITARYWKIELVKNSGLPYLGELFFAEERYSFFEWNPQPSWGGAIDLSQSRTDLLMQNADSVHYYKQPPELTFKFPFNRRVCSANNPVYEHAFFTNSLSAGRSPNNQVLILAEDRIALFGSFNPDADINVFAGNSADAEHVFVHRYPARFYGDQIF